MADIDAALEEEVLDLAERERVADIHHHREADNLGRAVEAAERVPHRQRLRAAAGALEPVSLTVPGNVRRKRRAKTAPKWARRRIGAGIVALLRALAAIA